MNDPDRESADLTEAYRHCRELASAHYENFPVASRLLPARMRDPVAAIYAFARRADDLADEGQVSAELRLEAIDAQRDALLAALDSASHPDPVCRALADACRRHHLPVDALLDLLSAFRQDISVNRYEDDAQLLDYCRRSANPVGRLLLHLAGRSDSQALAESDALCTALQLLNFLQDVDSDLRRRNRLYLPRTALRAAGLAGPAELLAAEHATAVRELVEARLAMIQTLLQASRPLPRRLPGRLRIEIRLTWLAARHLHGRLLRRGARLTDPCRLGGGEKLRLLLLALLPLP